MFKIVGQKFHHTIIFMMISFLTGYLLFLFCAFVSAAFFVLLFDIHGADIRLMIVTCLLNLALLMPILKLKVNYSFIPNRGISGICIFITETFFILYGLSRDKLSPIGFLLVIIGMGLSAFGLFVWISREKKIIFNEKVHQLLTQDKNAQINELLRTHDYLTSRVHKDGKSLLSIFHIVEIIAKESSDSPVKDKALKTLAELKSLRAELSDEAAHQLGHTILPVTKIVLLDAVFIYMADVAKKKDIAFKLIINKDVKEINNFITLAQLQTLASDLIENAIIATEKIDTKKAIEVSIQMIDGAYEFKIKDSGIQFEINTLINLGKKRTTTHAETGGNGIGFMTVFEIMSKTGASLIIDEYAYNTNEFNKAITIRFDGKRKFMIRSYRNEEIKTNYMVGFDNQNIIFIDFK